MSFMFRDGKDTDFAYSNSSEPPYTKSELESEIAILESIKLVNLLLVLPLIRECNMAYLNRDLQDLSELKGSYRFEIHAGALILLSCAIEHRFQELSKFLSVHSDLPLKHREWLEAEKEVLRSFLVQVDKLGV